MIKRQQAMPIARPEILINEYPLRRIKFRYAILMLCFNIFVPPQCLLIFFFLLNPAIQQMDNPIAIGSFFSGMGNLQDGGAFLVQFFQ